MGHDVDLADQMAMDDFSQNLSQAPAACGESAESQRSEIAKSQPSREPLERSTPKLSALPAAPPGKAQPTRKGKSITAKTAENTNLNAPPRAKRGVASSSSQESNPPPRTSRIAPSELLEGGESESKVSGRRKLVAPPLTSKSPNAGSENQVEGCQKACGHA
jgi:hypothetical protein